jgi:hypothetical protein
VVDDEGYSASAPDLSSLVSRLRLVQPDVIFHTGYNPDISLFLRQARERGLTFSALVGHGAGYTAYSRLKESVRNDANYFFDGDPLSIWETNKTALKPELIPIIMRHGRRTTDASPTPLSATFDTLALQNYSLSIAFSIRGREASTIIHLYDNKPATRSGPRLREKR